MITNGFDAEDFDGPTPSRTDGEFRVVHTGLFASDGNPLKLWDALASACKADAGFAARLRVRLAGKVDPEIVESLQERGLSENLVLLGYLSHKDSVAELRSADLVLLPLRQSPEYRKVLPGKIFECIASGRPVLGIGPEDSAAAKLLRETGAGVMVDWDKTPDIAALTAAAGGGTPLGGNTFPAASTINRASLSREELTKKMVELFESLI